MFLLSLSSNEKNKNFRKYYLLLFSIIQILGILFLIIQREPLITPLLSILFVSLIFLLLYKIYYNNLNSAYNYIYILLTASIISITLLNYFNLQLEREALKTTAVEVNRPNDNLFRFLVTDILTSSANDQKIIEQFAKGDLNFDAAAFTIWSGSTLQKESLNSLVTIYNNQQKLIGKFDVGINDDFSPVEYFDKINSNEPTIKEVTTSSNQEQKIYCGIIPVKDRDHILGYISASILFDIQNLGAENIPDFIESKKNIVNSVVNLRLLKIFDFENSKLKDVYGNIYPSREQSEPILKTHFSVDNDAWMNLTLNGENYLTYILKTQQDNIEKITSVSLRSKRLTWNLFNFFKLFIIHSIFITGLSFIIFLFTFRNIKYTFRSRLLFSFLFISIIPVIILAIYNRQIVEQRSEEAILNELNERVQYLENHVKEQFQKYKDRDDKEIFENAGKELGISFGVFDGTNQIFNSKSEYYTSGLFTSKLNPEAYYQLSYLSYREYFTQEQIENYTYNAFYKKLNIGDKQFIVGVNDAFNKVHLTFSTLDIDVFLFGVYSFAAIIIIIISTWLSNRISDPIRRLTRATDSVAQGDLNVYIQNKEKGGEPARLDGHLVRSKPRVAGGGTRFERVAAGREFDPEGCLAVRLDQSDKTSRGIERRNLTCRIRLRTRGMIGNHRPAEEEDAALDAGDEARDAGGVAGAGRGCRGAPSAPRRGEDGHESQSDPPALHVPIPPDASCDMRRTSRRSSSTTSCAPPATRRCRG